MGHDAIPELAPTSELDCQPEGWILLSHRVTAEHDFGRAADDLFRLIRAAQLRHPDAERRLVLTIDGHSGDRAGFDADFFEFQQEFLLGALGPYLTMIHSPLSGTLENRDAQRNDIQDKLRIE